MSNSLNHKAALALTKPALAEGESDRCSVCQMRMPDGHMLCEEHDGMLCGQCWENSGCYDNHGESCAVSVWTDGHLIGSPVRAALETLVKPESADEWSAIAQAEDAIFAAIALPKPTPAPLEGDWVAELVRLQTFISVAGDLLEGGDDAMRSFEKLRTMLASAPPAPAGDGVQVHEIAQIIDPQCRSYDWVATEAVAMATGLQACKERRQQWGDDDCERDGSCSECQQDIAEAHETPASKARRKSAYDRARTIIAALTPAPAAEDGWRERATIAEARVKRLAEALHPFAWHLFPGDDWGDNLCGPETMASAGMVRAARAALAPTTGGEGK